MGKEGRLGSGGNKGKYGTLGWDISIQRRKRSEVSRMVEEAGRFM